MTMTRASVLFGSTLLAGGLVLSGCTGVDTGDPGTEPVTVPPPVGGDDGAAEADGAEGSGNPDGTEAPGGGTDAEVPSQYAGPLAAVAAAEEETGGTAFEIDSDDGAWEVHVAVGDDEIEVRVDSTGQEVLGTEREGGLDSDDREGLEAAQISLSEAVIIAINESGASGPLDDVDLTREDGRHAWDVNFDDLEVYVDVTDGSIIKIDD
ncbi:PepSY domain-containing protein [Sediminivirga luteola]|nr:hypothetical protein [Sediminivirga luteola]